MYRPAVTRAPEEFVADTIVRLSIEPVQRAVVRSLEVVKSRGHEYALGGYFVASTTLVVGISGAGKSVEGR